MVSSLLKLSSHIMPFGIVGVISVYLLAKVIEKDELIAPVHGPITSNFGQRGSYFHNGTDIGVPVGTPVKCPSDGIVLGTYQNSAGGLQLMVKHNNGYTTGYAHLSKILVSKNTRVKKNQYIAYTGNTGQSTGPHLHFTLRKNNNLINPKLLINFA